MKTIIFPLPGNEKRASAIATGLQADKGEVTIRQFPDGETYIKVNTDVRDKNIILVCTLDHPDDKLLPLYFLARTLKELGAKHITLVAPYLAYMRQDKRFHPGESVTSTHFAALLSFFVDRLITVDPHLHRRSSLAEIYTIPASVVHAAGHISNWIKNNIPKPLLIGPDMESEQWVSEVAKNAEAPYIVLQKIRHGDADVEVSVPQVEKFLDCTPVLVDDIISTARTMIETIGHLKKTPLKAPVCIGVHGIFAGKAYEALQAAGTEKVVSCNTIDHVSNGIDVNDLLLHELKKVGSTLKVG